MSLIPTIAFSSAKFPSKGTLVALAGEGGTLGPQLKANGASKTLKAAIKAAGFEGGFGKKLDVLVPKGTDYDRILVFGLGKADELDERSWLRLGGKIATGLAGIPRAALLFDVPKGVPAATAANACDLAMGVQLASYRFDRYKTASKSKKQPRFGRLSVHVKGAPAAKRLWNQREGVAAGVMLARDLVNEPANILTPIAFAKRAVALKKLGCDVQVLDEKAMSRLKMDALLGVARGSRNAPRMAIIQWKGAAKGSKPLAFVGKGVTFDTGGISLKPAGGMEDMKGDMGGAAAVMGLMHAVAARKARANVVGIIALVENMPDGDAQRPGDVVTSMSGQTIEVLNTDAEGRLVLADALWHCRKKFKPQFMVNLATLTGAILVALGQHHAGLFSNDDELSNRLSGAGEATGEKVWRLPLGPEYDKLIDSKNADMKNIGGRMAGSITAGQFLQRFVGDTPWAHLDVAGTAMNAPQSDINKSWASGYGVRLLDRLIADHYEK